MSIAINTVTYGGRLTRDPESRAAGEATVCRFALAINRRWRDKSGEQREDTVYIDAEAWNAQANIVQEYVKKGDQLIIEGRTIQDDYQDAQGNPRRRYAVRCTAVHLMPREERTP